MKTKDIGERTRKALKAAPEAVEMLRFAQTEFSNATVALTWAVKRERRARAQVKSKSLNLSKVNLRLCLAESEDDLRSAKARRK